MSGDGPWQSPLVRVEGARERPLPLDTAWAAPAELGSPVEIVGPSPAADTDEGPPPETMFVAEPELRRRVLVIAVGYFTFRALDETVSAVTRRRSAGRAVQLAERLISEDGLADQDDQLVLAMAYEMAGQNRNAARAYGAGVRGRDLDESAGVRRAALQEGDPSGFRDGIILEDDTTLEPTNIRGVERSPVRLVFLNACQLARGGRTLGDYAGMATALLKAGAQGVIAPLWKVDDGVAKDVATKFYRALSAGTRPAEFLAGERAAASIDGEGTPSGTRLAYLFFGHPGLMVAGLHEREE